MPNSWDLLPWSKSSHVVTQGMPLSFIWRCGAEKTYPAVSHSNWVPWELTEHWCYTLKPAKTSQKNSSLMGNIIHKDVWELGLKGLVWCLNWDLMHSCHWVSLLPNVHFFCLADTLQTSKPSKTEETCSRWGSNRLHPRNLGRMRTLKQTFPLSY